MLTSDLANFCVAGATMVLSIVTWLTVRSSKRHVLLLEKQLDDLKRPLVKVHIDIEPNSSTIWMYITNVGGGPARDLQLTMDKDFFFNGDKSKKNIRNYPVFQKKIDSFHPGSNLKFMLGAGFSVLNSDACPRQFSIKASYSSGSIVYGEEMSFDLDLYMSNNTRKSEIFEGFENVVKSIDSLKGAMESR